jgi:hypothetical protein
VFRKGRGNNKHLAKQRPKERKISGEGRREEIKQDRQKN